MSIHIWLRAESKPAEKRSPLTPGDAGILVKAGLRVTVESSNQRVFPASEYAPHGCEVADCQSWFHADSDVIVLGLKELPYSDEPLVHRHIYFAHVYKGQSGWGQILNRYVLGRGLLYDLEYLTDENHRRVAAFGYWAGYSGAALALMAWVGQKLNNNPVLLPVESFRNRDELLAKVNASIGTARRVPRVLVIGAQGKSGGGAVQLCRSAGADVTEWDLKETKMGGPFAEILEFDIMVNCVLVQSKIPPFITSTLLDRTGRRLGMICDVSCDPYGDQNPLPIYETCTSFANPVIRLPHTPDPLDLIAIDHLPSLLPRESSEDFSRQLLPHLLQLDKMESGVWQQARNMFEMKCEKINES
ncbi:MAG TPA: saccharopine dehydrogenase [Verrucomicrobiales bacterium]|nr:saccharopine dehydrogenase [Verrucomicrobiales bacterium]